MSGQLRRDCGAFFFRTEAEFKRERERGRFPLRIGAAAVIERFVEGLADFGRQRPQFGGVAVAAEQLGALGDGDRFAIAVSSRSDLRIDDPRTVVMAPVAETEFNDAVVRQLFEVTYLLPHLPVIPCDDRSG